MCAALALPLATPAEAVAQQMAPLPIPDFDTRPGPDPKETKDAAEKWKEKFNRPVYNPGTKSYFEYYFPGTGFLYDSEKQYGWEEAEKIATTRTFHGVRGRLAVIKTAETNKFIVDHLHPEDGAWIGLKYMCDLRTLRWVTGEFWPLDAYHNWGAVWNIEGTSPKGRSRSACLGYMPWMGVHYWGSAANYKWNANGTGKRFGWMIIEYPTGKP
jgi:hypothetical protein